MSVRVEAGDCLEVMARLAAEGLAVDAVVTDPPYHLTTAGRFGAAGAKGPRDYGKSGVYKRAAAGFMGKAWDGGSAARFFYTAKAGAEDRWGSRHPTVKPVALIRWLARLVTPPGGTLLDPFAGSGTAGVAALAEGFGAVLIEREAEYLADIKERLAFYAGAGRHSLAGKNRKSEQPGAEGLPLFGEER